MQNEQKDIKVSVDRYTRFCLTAIAVLLTILLVGLWADGVHVADDALAAEPFGVDAGAQRNTIIKAAEATNAKLGELISLLKSGQVKVQIAGVPKKAAAGGAHARPTGK